MVSLLDISLDDFMVQLKLSTRATLGTEESGHCREVAVSGGSTVLLLKHFRFLFLLRVVAILASKVNSESHQTGTFKFQVYCFATIQNIKYLNKKI